MEHYCIKTEKDIYTINHTPIGEPSAFGNALYLGTTQTGMKVVAKL